MPIDYAFARLLWFIIRRNVHADLDVISWMRPLDDDLWVKPDTNSVRSFRDFYRRNLPTPSTPVNLRTEGVGRASVQMDSGVLP
jgi:hypothetical protein